VQNPDYNGDDGHGHGFKERGKETDRETDRQIEREQPSKNNS
jgi:hypothetical protein